MTELDIQEQQKADEVLRLEIAYSNLYQTYISGNMAEMKNKYIAAGNVNIPNFANSVFNNTRREMLSNGMLPDKLPSDIRDINNETILRMNIIGCLNALQEEINVRNLYQVRYTYAQNKLYQTNRTFRPDDVIHQNQQGQQLKVSDLLAVSKYALSIAEAVAPDNEDFSKANAAITTLQGLEAILNNKSEDRPTNKMLHLVTSFLSSTVKDSLKDKEAKRNVTIRTIVLDLAIDFFCKK